LDAFWLSAKLSKPHPEARGPKRDCLVSVQPDGEVRALIPEIEKNTVEVPSEP
jgi:hypothetical protein